MELLKAIEKLNKVTSDAEKIGKWLDETSVNNRPLYGQNWTKIEKAIENIITELYSEARILELKISEAAEGITVDINNK